MKPSGHFDAALKRCARLVKLGVIDYLNVRRFTTRYGANLACPAPSLSQECHRR
jgi:hypothetical protein